MKANVDERQNVVIEASNDGFQFSLRSILIATLLVAVSAYFWGCISSYAITGQVADQISEGMSSEQVLRIAGQPHWKENGVWYYRVWNGPVPFSDPLNVEFDVNDQVKWVSF